MQSFEAYGQMIEHLRFFFVSMLFNPGVWVLALAVYAVGWVIGRSLRSSGYGGTFILLYLAGCALSFVFRSAGWDLLILGGIPFVLGVYVGKKKQ